MGITLRFASAGLTGFVPELLWIVSAEPEKIETVVMDDSSRDMKMNVGS